MYCPTCAAENAADQRFCRSCGQELTLVSQALTGTGPVALAGRIGSELKEYKQRKAEPRLTRALYFLILGGAAAIFTLTIFLIFPTGPATILPMLLLSLIFLGTGTKEYMKYKRASAELHTAVEPSPTGISGETRRLIQQAPFDAVPVPSVTEDTTRPLENVRKRD